jgi:hypothetical protein
MVIVFAEFLRNGGCVEIFILTLITEEPLELGI